MYDYPQGLRGSSLTAGKMLKNIEIKMSYFKESISIVQSKSIVGTAFIQYICLTAEIDKPVAQVKRRE